LLPGRSEFESPFASSSKIPLPRGRERGSRGRVHIIGNCAILGYDHRRAAQHRRQGKTKSQVPHVSLQNHLAFSTFYLLHRRNCTLYGNHSKRKKLHMTPANAKLRLGPQVLKVNTFYKVQVCWRMRTRKLGSQSGARNCYQNLYRLPDRSLAVSTAVRDMQSGVVMSFNRKVTGLLLLAVVSLPIAVRADTPPVHHNKKKPLPPPLPSGNSGSGAAGSARCHPRGCSAGHLRGWSTHHCCPPTRPLATFCAACASIPQLTSKSPPPPANA